MIRLSFLVWLCVIVQGTSFAFADGWEGWTVNAMLENDMFGSDTDRHYTHGTRFSLASPEGDVPDWMKEGASYFPLFSDEGKLRSTFALGQNLYSPSDIKLTDPNLMDRPYAGWLYGSFGLVSDTGSRVDNIELSLGMVGPASLGRQTQTFVHKVVDSPKPQGWDHQLKNEPGVILAYERKLRRFVDYDTGLFDLEFDASPYGGVVLGNIFTHLETGAMFRIGQDLAKDRGGPPRIRPSLPGSDYYAVSDGYSWYLFAGMNGRAVARNIFLDGNSFADGYSTHKKPFVGDFQVGFGVTVQNARLAYTQIFRTKEFKNQAQQDQFGAITLSYQF